ncbi:multicopper oxidase domain-containing protein, partial [Sphingomonas sp.]|uniref:multicopper oxidase domain-containing protein n=1 Tax=Sphingomonas sp. TaxID=28214 RepID=UPI00286AB60E
VTNTLAQDSSIHWHGVLVPFTMDGVPGVSFPGIAPGTTFDYTFPIIQAGTYWYHSHSGYQEQDGLYGPIVIDPAGPDPIAFDREHVIILSEHSPMLGATIFRKLKQMGGGYFNMQRQTLSGLIAGRDQTQQERLEWAKMRMDPADIADVTGSTYTFTVNGHGPFDNWTGLFTPGERVRLRIINAASQTNFNVRIPDLPMTVVAADGQNVRPVTVDEFQIGVAETFDVIVTPGDRAYSFVSESIDRSGLGRATLAPRAGMSAPVPPLRPRPLTTMMDMGMGDMAGMDMKDPGMKRGIDPSAQQNASRLLAKLTGWREPTDHGSMAASAAAPMVGMSPTPTDAMAGMAGMDHGAAAPAAEAAMPGMDHSAAGGASAGSGHPMSMNMRDATNAPGVKMGPGVQTITPMPSDRSGEAPQGLDGLDHRVLVYRDLVALDRNPDVRAPSRALDIHLTGNMERYMWSFDGVKLSDPAEPIPFRLGERVRVTLVNDTMMPHPIHLHGHFFELVTGHGATAPRKHSVNVPPGGKVSFDVTADAPGDWAFHCHNLYHMAAGMMRVVTVRPTTGAAA